jgi:hypothetical protein
MLRRQELRQDERRHEKADFVLWNPVRRKWVARPEAWPFGYFGAGERSKIGRHERRAAANENCRTMTLPAN